MAVKYGLSVLAVLLVISFGVNMILGWTVGAVASQVVGTRVEVGGLGVGLLDQSVTIRGFRMHNPAGFPPGLMVDLPLVHVACDLPAILGGTLHLRQVDVQLKEIGLVKNSDGKLNVDSLKVAQQKDGKGDVASEPMKMQIDLLNVAMGRIVSKDYSIGGPPSVQVHDINLKKSYKDITSAEQLALLILSEPMKQAGIKGAAIYGAAMLTGVGIIPVAAMALFGSKDSIEDRINVPLDRLFGISVETLKRMGTVKQEDQAAGAITAEASGATVTIRLKPDPKGGTSITISARKFMLPKPDVAGGVLYEIQQRLK